MSLQQQAFRVKAMISGVKPIAAKIGKKEGLKFDQRYFVYENREKRNGDVTSKRIGVVKSMKVVDNRNITTGQTEPSGQWLAARNGRFDRPKRRPETAGRVQGIAARDHEWVRCAG